MQKLNLYLDFEFTSLSPDAQPISIGIVSDIPDFVVTKMGDIEFYTKPHPLITGLPKEKSFYAEFTDFDINRCDDWVKENVVGKLKHYGQQSGGGWSASDDCFKYECYNDTDRIKVALKEYLEQFSDYEIQIVVDCGTWDWYWFLQLVAEWYKKDCPKPGYCTRHEVKIGLPILPPNISPVPQYLNDIIAIKKGISPKEAFDLNREELAFGWHENQGREMVNSFKERELEFFGLPKENKESKHNSLWDAKIIKAIFNKLMQ